MTVVNKPSENALEIADSLGLEAINALLAGGSWEYVPDGVDFTALGDTFCIDCVDKNCGFQYHKRWHQSGYRIEGGKVYHTIHEFENESDSDPDVIDEKDIDAPDYDEWYQGNYGYDAQQASWMLYYHLVARTGDDRLNVFNVDRTIKAKWLVKLTCDYEGKVLFIAAHPHSVGWIERDAIRRTEQLPKELRDYLCLNDRRVVSDVTLDEIAATEEVFDRVGDCIICVVEVAIARTEGSIRRDIKLLASSELENAGCGTVDDSEENPRWEGI